MRIVGRQEVDEVDVCRSVWIQAVSYTHLDVYKRQILYCKLKSNKPSSSESEWISIEVSSIGLNNAFVILY